MFKNRVVQMQMVKKNQSQPTDESSSRWSLEQINKFAKAQMRNVAIIAVSVYAAKVILDTSSQIAIQTAMVKVR